MERTIMSGIKLGSVDVGSNTRRREGEVGDKLSSGEALELLSGHWQHCIVVGNRCREKHRPGGFGRQSSPAISIRTLDVFNGSRPDEAVVEFTQPAPVNLPILRHCSHRLSS